MPEFPSFAKALMAFFDKPKLTIAEVKELTPKDRAELSAELNSIGFTHPPYSE